MMKYWISSLVLVVLISLPVLSEVGGDFGREGISSWDLSEKKEKTVKKPDAFIVCLARYFFIKEADLARLWARGYGRNELIKLILISKSSGKSVREIVREREKETKLRDISRKYGVDYSSITLHAADIRMEIDSMVVLSSDTLKNRIDHSSSTVVAPSSSTVIPK